jgi:hypothetical protein
VNVQEDIRSYHLAIVTGAQLLHGSPALVFDARTVLSYIAPNADVNILGIGIKAGIQPLLMELHYEESLLIGVC